MIHKTWQFWDFTKIFREKIRNRVILCVRNKKLESVNIKHSLGLKFVKISLLNKSDLGQILDLKPRLCLRRPLNINISHSGFASETAIEVIPGIQFLLATHS